MYKRIYYDQNNNKIYMWYVDTDGCHRKLVETPEIEYYIPDKTMKSPIVDIYGTPVKRQTSKSVYDLRDFIKNGVKTCEASLPEDMKFLHRYYKGQPDLDVNMDELQVATIDIEVDADKFPKAELAEYPINLITVHFSRQKQTVTFGTREYTGSDESVKNYHYCATETILLEKFITMFRKAKTDFISGWNSKSFDVPYIINRCKKLSVEKSLSPVGVYRELASTKKKMVEDSGYEIAGISQLDGLMLYKQFEQKKRVSYSLDAIAKLELGKQKSKVKFNRDTDKSQEEWNKFVEYNVNDVILTVGIDEKKKYVELAVRFCYAGLIPFDKVYSSIARITGCAVRFLHDNGMVYPDPPKFHKESYPGAFVMAKKGFYKHLVNIDATSLYPTIMRFSNISPETLVLNPTEGLENLIHTPASEYFTCETPNGKFEMSGVYFRKDKKGVIPSIVEKFFNERVYWKTMQKIAGDVAKGIDASEISKNRKIPLDETKTMRDLIVTKGYTADYCDKQQYVKKIYINSIYGTLGTPHFGFYNPKNAAAVTVWGQTIIQFTARILNAYTKDTWHLVAKDMFPEYNISNVKPVKNDTVILIDTDSVVGDTILHTSNGDVTISDLYDSCSNKSMYKDNKFIGTLGIETTSLSMDSNGCVESKPIKYVMKHEVTKKMYKITVGNSSVICTEDHSVIIERDGIITEASPRDIKESDLLIRINHD